AASSFDVVGLGTWHRSALLWWNVCRKIGQRGAGGLNLVADGNARAGTRRQVHVDARTETDEAVTLTRVEIVTRFHVAQNTLRDQAGHLYRSDHMTAWCAHHHGVALVLERGLVERCVEKLACKVFDRKDRALYRSTIRMNIEHVHEHTDLECLAVCVGVVHFFDGHNPPVGGRQHGQFAVRGYAWRVAKELQNE